MEKIQVWRIIFIILCICGFIPAICANGAQALERDIFFDLNQWREWEVRKEK